MPFQHDSQNFANNSIGISLMSNAVNALLTTTNNSLILSQAAFEAMNSKVLSGINTISYADSTYSILDDTSANVNGNNYVVITGENFSVNANVIIGTTYALSTNVVNTTTIFAQLPTLNVGNYTLYIVNNDNFCVLRSNGINYSQTPQWVTSTTLSVQTSNVAFNGTFSATASNTYILAAGSTLPAGMNLVSNGYYYGNISVSQDSSYSFTINAVDAEFQDTPRTFSMNVGWRPVAEYITIAGGGGGGSIGGFTTSGHGGGGGGGVLTGNLQVKSGVTYNVIVGAGGSQNSPGSVSWFKEDVSNTLIAYCYGGGSGGAGAYSTGNGADGGNGGSGGGGGGAQNHGYSGGLAGKGIYSGSTFIDGPRQGYDGSQRYNEVRGHGSGGGAGGAASGLTAGDGIEWPAGSGQYYGGGGGGTNGTNGLGGGIGGVGGGGGANDVGGGGQIIIRYSDAYANATNTTGSPTFSNTGGYKTYTFTGSGKITW